MDFITFTKDGVTKRTDKDFGLVPTGDIDLPDKNGQGTINFMIRFGDVPISMRANDIVEFLMNSIVTAVFSNDHHRKYVGKFDVTFKNTIGTGVKVVMEYEVSEQEKQLKRKSQKNSKWEWDSLDMDKGVI